MAVWKHKNYIHRNRALFVKIKIGQNLPILFSNDIVSEMGLCVCLGACVCGAVSLTISYLAYNHLEDLENSCQSNKGTTDK